MPTSYQVFVAESIPEWPTFRVGEQLNLLANNEHNLEECSTVVTRSGRIEALSLEIFDVEHDFLFHLDQPGRARGHTFREFVTPYRFRLFLNSSSNLAFHYALVRTKKKVAHDFVRRMNQRQRGFDLVATRVDFGCLRPKLEYVKGAWFGSMRAANLSTTGLFGPHVDQSDEFQHAEMLGELSNLLVEVVDGSDLAHSVMFTADGGIVLYRTYVDVEEELEIVENAIANLLGGCIAGRGSSAA